MAIVGGAVAAASQRGIYSLGGDHTQWEGPSDEPRIGLIT